MSVLYSILVLYLCTSSLQLVLKHPQCSTQAADGYVPVFGDISYSDLERHPLQMMKNMDSARISSPKSVFCT